VGPVLGTVTPCSRSKAKVPTTTFCLIDLARNSLAGVRLKASSFRNRQATFLRFRDQRRGQWVLADRSRLAARLKISSSVWFSQRLRTAPRLPFCERPVLSTTSVSTFSRISSASAFLMRTPARARDTVGDHDRHRSG